MSSQVELLSPFEAHVLPSQPAMSEQPPFWLWKPAEHVHVCSVPNAGAGLSVHVALASPF